MRLMNADGIYRKLHFKSVGEVMAWRVNEVT
jgi:hypothetical protein